MSKFRSAIKVASKRIDAITKASTVDLVRQYHAMGKAAHAWIKADNIKQADVVRETGVAQSRISRSMTIASLFPSATAAIAHYKAFELTVPENEDAGFAVWMAALTGGACEVAKPTVVERAVKLGQKMTKRQLDSTIRQLQEIRDGK